MCWEMLKTVSWKKSEGDNPKNSEDNPKKGDLKLVLALAALEKKIYLW